MKKKLLFIHVLYLFFISNVIFSQSISVNKSDIIQIYGNDHFKITEQDNYFNIQTNKEPWETITIKVNNPHHYKEYPLNLLIDNNSITNYSISILAKNTSQNNEIALINKTLYQGSTLITLDLSKHIPIENQELLLILHVEKGKNWKGTFSIKAFNYLNIENEDKLISFPNPCKDHFSIICNENSGKLSICNEMGLVLFFDQVSTNNLLNYNLASGNYTIIFETKNKKYKSKITVIK